MTNELKKIIDIIDDAKAEEIKVIDVKDLTSITDTIIICQGRSSRHVKAIADRIIMYAKKETTYKPRHQGLTLGQWALVDLGDIVVHVMLPEIRDFYQLEKLWDQNIINTKD